MKKYLKLMRVSHYIKNMLIFMPLFFSERITEPILFMRTALGAVGFCFICSFIYIFNDIRDIEKDRLHEEKKMRPLASGAVSKKKACIIGGALLILAAAVLILSGANIGVWICCIVYILINIAYSCGLKNVPVADIAILGAGYPLRVIYGGFLSGIEISSWLFLTTLCISFYLGLGKRRGELSKYAGSGNNGGAVSTRPVLDKYDINYLDNHMYLTLGLGIAFYSLWALEKSQLLVYTVPIVLLIIMKYNLILSKDADGDPINTVLKSKGLIMLIALYVLSVIYIMYIL